MKDTKNDRRVKYTKMVLRDALVKLMQKQHISSITVTSLCEIADVNRSTFYAHYTDQYDLLRNIEQEVMASLRNYLQNQDYSNNKPVSVQVLNSILDYVKENADLFKALLSENCDYAIQKDVVQLSQIVTSKLNPKYSERTQMYIMEFGITGCISVLQKWLKDGMVESTKEMSELILKILYHGIMSFDA